MSFVAIGGIGAGLGAAFKIYQGVKQNSLADQINPQYDVYKGSSAVGQNVAAAQNAYQGRMAGAGSAEENLLRAQQNQFANASRGATDSSQLLALAGAGAGQAAAGVNNLATAEGQNQRGLLDNLQAAYGQKVQDDRAVNQSQLEKYQIDTGAKQALRGAGMNNIAGGINDTAGMALQMGQLNSMNKKLNLAGAGIGSAIGGV